MFSRPQKLTKSSPSILTVKILSIFVAFLENTNFKIQDFFLAKIRTCCKASQYRGSSLSTIFGIWKKSYYAKFVLVGTTQPISTSTNFTTQQSGSNSTSTNFIPIVPKFVLVEIVLVETVLVGDPLYKKFINSKLTNWLKTVTTGLHQKDFGLMYDLHFETAYRSHALKRHNWVKSHLGIFYYIKI